MYDVRFRVELALRGARVLSGEAGDTPSGSQRQAVRSSGICRPSSNHSVDQFACMCPIWIGLCGSTVPACRSAGRDAPGGVSRRGDVRD